MRHETGLADPRLAFEDQHPTVSCFDRIEAPLDRCCLVLASRQEADVVGTTRAPTVDAQRHERGHLVEPALDLDRDGCRELGAFADGGHRGLIAQDALTCSTHQSGREVHDITHHGVGASLVATHRPDERPTGGDPDATTLSDGVQRALQFDRCLQAAQGVVFVRLRRRPEHTDDDRALVIDEDLIDEAIELPEHLLHAEHRRLGGIEGIRSAWRDVEQLHEHHRDDSGLGEPIALPCCNSVQNLIGHISLQRRP